MEAPPSPRKNKKTVTYLFQMFFPSFCFHHFYHQVLQPFHIFFGWILSSFSPSPSSFLRISIWSSWLFERNSTSSPRLLLHSAFFLLLFLLARILRHCLTAPFSHFFCMCAFSFSFLFNSDTIAVSFSFYFWFSVKYPPTKPPFLQVLQEQYQMTILLARRSVCNVSVFKFSESFWHFFLRNRTISENFVEVS